MTSVTLRYKYTCKYLRLSYLHTIFCKEDIRRYLQVYLERKGTVVITTHEESELDMCSKVYVMKNGQLNQVDRRLRGEALVKMF